MDTPHPKKSKVDLDLNPDYITNLPAEVKDKILVQLPIKEAVRMSILSSKWIDSWISIPNLVFEETTTDTEVALIKFVDMVLLVHQGPIEKFELVSGHACNEAIGRWMLILSRNNIKELKLIFESLKNCQIPFCLVKCIALERLCLSGCSINFPQCFQGFKLMRTLILLDFDSSGISIENLVLACPLLENLSLSSFRQQGCLRIVAANLTSLDVFGDFHDICLETPKLVSASIYLITSNGDYQKFSLAKHSKESNITRALGHLSNIQSLVISGDFSDYLSMGSILENLHVIFNHLAEIVVHLSIYPEEIAAALCLFQNAPKLEAIYIEFWPSQHMDQPHVQSPWEPKVIQDSLFKSLKVVNVMYSHSQELSLQTTKSIVEFAKLVLTTAPVLEKLNIIDLDDAKVIFYMLECLPKLSKKAEIVFVKGDVED